MNRMVEIGPEPNFDIALKDLNFKRKLHFGPEFKRKFVEQLEKDCQVNRPNL